MRRRSSASSPTPGSSSPQGGYFLWVDLPRGTDVGALFDAAAERGRPVRQGTDFVLEGGESSLRLAYSGVTPEEIEEGVARLAEAYREVVAATRARMRPDEVAPLGDSPARRPPASPRQIHEVHDGIAGACLARVGPASTPVRSRPRPDRAARLHGARGALTRAVVRGRRATRRARPQPADCALDCNESPPGALSVGALNGAFGDTLEQPRQPARAADGRARRAAATSSSMTAARAPPTRTRSRELAVFVHGLCETEDAWKLGAARHVPYGDRLRDRARLHARLYVRYNSGRHISENGREFADCCSSG